MPISPPDPLTMLAVGEYDGPRLTEAVVAINGKHGDDAPMLRVASTFELAVGGDSSPSVLAGVTP